MEREQELDGEMGDSCVTPPVGLALTLFFSPPLSLSVNDGWEGRGLGYLSEWLCYIPEKGRGRGVVQRVVEKNTDACQQSPSQGAILPCFRPGGQ